MSTPVFRSVAFVAAFTFAAAPAQAQAAPAVLSVSVPLYRTNAAGTKWWPLRSRRPVKLDVLLYDGPSTQFTGQLVYDESFTIVPLSVLPSDPAAGVIHTPTTLGDHVTVALGADPDHPLPANLFAQELWISTRTTTLDGAGVPAKAYIQGPTQPLGFAGFTRGQRLSPAAVELLDADALRIAAGAGSGLVLASDDDGWAAWRQVSAAALAEGAVTGDAILDGTIAADDLAVGAVGGEQILDGSVGANDLGPDAVHSTALADGAVGAAALAAGAVGPSALADGSVTSAKLAAGAVSAAALADGAVVSTALADGAVGAAALASGAVSAAALANGAVGADALADGAVGAAALAAGAVSAAALADGAVGSAALADDAVTSAKLAAGAVAGEHLAAGGVTSAAIADGSVTGTDILDGSITGADLTTGDLGTLHAGSLVYDGGALDLEAGYDIRYRADRDADSLSEWHRWYRDGTTEAMRLEENGDLKLDGQLHVDSVDLAERFPTAAGAVPPGSVVALDPARSEHVLPAQRGVSEAVIGVVSGAPGVLLGSDMHGLDPALLVAADQAAALGNVELAGALRERWRATELSRSDAVPVALAGRVPVRVDHSGGPIRIGDPLGLGAAAGVAARWTGVGPVIGVAAEPWSGATATVLMVCRVESTGAASLARGATAALAFGAPVQGEGVVPAGVTAFTVVSAGLTPNSRPLVTLFADPGSRHWIAERGAGWFVIAFAETTRGEVPFGFQAGP